MVGIMLLRNARWILLWAVVRMCAARPTPEVVRNGLTGSVVARPPQGSSSLPRIWRSLLEKLAGEACSAKLCFGS